MVYYYPGGISHTLFLYLSTDQQHTFPSTINLFRHMICVLAIQVQVSQFTRILVVAPSNAAVDEIVRRVMDKGFVDQSDASLRYVSQCLI